MNFRNKNFLMKIVCSKYPLEKSQEIKSADNKEGIAEAKVGGSRVPYCCRVPSFRPGGGGRNNGNILNYNKLTFFILIALSSFIPFMRSANLH